MQLAFNKYAKDVMIRFGVSPEGKKSAKLEFNTDFYESGKPMSLYCEKVIQTQLHPGLEMRKL